MKRSGLLACVLVLAALRTWAADEPEAVYAKFHAAALAADFSEMRKWGSAKKGDELASQPATVREAGLALMSRLLPKYYKVERKTIDAGGNSATLHVSAANGLYGTVLLLQESGEWKVDEAKWAQ